VNGREPGPVNRPEPSLGDTIRGALIFVDEDETVFEPPPMVVPWRGQARTLSLPSRPYSSHFDITGGAFDILNTINTITPDFFNFGRSTDLSSFDPSVPIVINTPTPFFGGSAEQYTIPRGPSMEFAKQTWWENLLDNYSNDPHHSAKKILQDLHFLSVWSLWVHAPTNILVDLITPFSGYPSSMSPTSWIN
jgi:hypothetical protein